LSVFLPHVSVDVTTFHVLDLNQAFVHSCELKSRIIPASVSELSGGAFVYSGIHNTSNISIEAGNVNGIRVVSYFGSDSKAILSGDIEILDPCFDNNVNLMF
jgi:hypothetical protein